MADALLRIADPTVGAVLGACGLILTIRRRQSLVGPLMLLACGCWFLGSVWSLFLFLHRGPLVHIHLSYPTGRIRRPLATVAVVCAYLTAVLEGVVDQPWVTLGTAMVVAVAAADIYARTSGPARRAGRPALIAALAFACVLALSAANRLLLWGYDLLVLLLYDLVICLVALLLATDLLKGRWTEATVADFVTQLGERPDTGQLTLAVQRALGDPTAQVGFWRTDLAGYVDDRGAPVDLPPDGNGDRSVITIDDHGRPTALLVHAMTTDNQQLITDVTTALRMAVGNARLRADIGSHISELSRARRRLVEAADQQRRRLEADLATGVQRRLARVDDLLAQATTDDDGAAEGRRSEIEAARTELARTQAELHDLTVGIRPAALDAGGLAAALPLLAHTTPASTRTRLEVTMTRLPAAVEGAVYFLCAESLTNLSKHADAANASIEVTVELGIVTCRVIDDGVGGADPNGSGLRGLRDRVEALDGTLTVADRLPRGTVVEAFIPIRTGSEPAEEGQ